MDYEKSNIRPLIESIYYKVLLEQSKMSTKRYISDELRVDREKLIDSLLTYVFIIV